MAKMRIFKFWNKDQDKKKKKKIQVLRRQLSLYKKILKINLLDLNILVKKAKKL